MAHARIATRKQSHQPAALFAVLVFAALTLATVPAAHASRPMAGVYVGGYGKPGAFIVTRLDLKPADGGRLEVELQQPFNVIGAIPVSAVEADGARIRFTATGTAHVAGAAQDLTRAAYDLTRTELGYAGVVTLPGARRKRSRWSPGPTRSNRRCWRPTRGLTVLAADAR